MGLSLLQLLEIVLVIAALGVVAYWGINTFLKARASRAIMEDARPYERTTDDTSRALLILGDSTGVGIGANTPEETVPGLLAAHMNASSVENYAVVGAGVEDLPSQVANAKLKRYHTILIMAGGNNILAFDDAVWTGRVLGEVLSTLPERERTFVMSAGNVGGATIFPPIIRPFHTMVNMAFHREFTSVCGAWGATYINLYEKPGRDIFLKHPEIYLSADGLHPSSAGYQLWFEKLEEKL